MILIVGIQELKELMILMGLDLKIIREIKTIQAADGENDVIKYRKEHPHCRYCVHKRYSDYSSFYCAVRRKDYFFNRAKYCNLYGVDTQL